MNIHVIDLHFQGLPHTIAAYLVEGPSGVALVETGPRSTLPQLQQGLAELGYQPADIRHILVTHIHLDHAGCAGWWAQQGARVYVHHVGAPHLIEPSKLLKSASRIYGERMDSLWGEVTPAPVEQISPIFDGDTIEIGGLAFTALDTPGHASHHHVLRLGDIAFSGDAAGIRIPGGEFVDLPAPPPEFDPESWRQTIARLRAENFAALYPTHFGLIGDVHFQLDNLERLMDEAIAFVGQRLREGVDRDELVEQYVVWQRERAALVGVDGPTFAKYEAANPHYMSVDGISRYWRKKMESGERP
jgi:glyoxylase-like metal-dependent hydrolase (beta-lactamase superfamily II)